MALPGPSEFFFALKRHFGPTGPVFRTGWAVKIVARKNWANFGPARFWPGPLLAQPSPARPARLPLLVRMALVVWSWESFWEADLGEKKKRGGSFLGEADLGEKKEGGEGKEKKKKRKARVLRKRIILGLGF